MKLYFIFTHIIFCVYGFSQQNKLETLNNRLRNCHKLVDKIQIYSEIGNVWKTQQKDSTYFYYQKAINECKRYRNDSLTVLHVRTLFDLYYENGDKTELIELCKYYSTYFKKRKYNLGYLEFEFLLASYYISSGQYKQGEHILTNLLRKTDINIPIEREIKSSCFCKRSICYGKEGDYTRAISDLNSSLALIDSNNYSSLIAVHTSFAEIFLSLNEKEKSFKHIQQSYKLARKYGVQLFEIKAIHMLASFYLEYKDFRNAEKWALKGRGKIQENQEYFEIVFDRLLYDIYNFSGQWNKANKKAKELLESATNLAIEDQLAYARLAVAEIELHNGNYHEAIRYAELAWASYKKWNDISPSKQTCKCLFTAYSSIGEFEKAFFFHRKYADFNEELNNTTQIQNALQKQYKFDLRRQAKIFQLEKNQERLINERKSQLQQYWIFGTIALLVILCVIFFFLYKIAKERKLNIKVLKQEKDNLDKLIHNLVHELRTPLTLIKGPTNDLRQLHKNDMLLNLIDKNTKRMLDLINQLLDFAKIKSGRSTLQNEITNISIFVQDTIDSFLPLAKHKGIELHYESKIKQPIIGVDPDKFYKVLSNLLSNAIKYTNQNGQICIRLSEAKSLLILEISDNGIGLKEEDRDLIFERFYQVDSDTKQQIEGTGLGLAFVKEMIALMKGSLELKSILGKGSEFVLSLPVVQYPKSTLLFASEDDLLPEQNPEDLGFNQTEEIKEKNMILIIEDNLDMHEYLHFLLKDEYRLILAQNAQEGIDLAKENIPDLILSDIMMPHKDGYQLVKELKEDMQTDHIPIIILSAKASFESKLTGLSFGAEDYLSKPFSSDELKLRINNQLILRKKLWKKYQEGALILNFDGEKEHPFIIHVNTVIQTRISDPITADDLALGLCISRTQLHRKLKALTGYSTMAYINQFKLYSSKKELFKGKLTISEIAYQYGYNDPSYYTRLFKKEFGFTPTELLNNEN